MDMEAQHLAYVNDWDGYVAGSADYEGFLFGQYVTEYLGSFYSVDAAALDCIGVWLATGEEGLGGLEGPY